MERDEGGISSKAPRIKIKQNPDCPNKEYNVIFKNFKISGPIQEKIINLH